MDHDPRLDQPLAEEPTNFPSSQPQMRSVRQTKFFSAPPYVLETTSESTLATSQSRKAPAAAGSAYTSGTSAKSLLSPGSAFTSGTATRQLASSGSVFSSGAGAPPKTRGLGREYPAIGRSFEGESYSTPVSSFEGESYSTPVYNFEGEGYTTPMCGGVASVNATKPLRLIHVGPCFMNGGVEQQTLSLAKFLDPRRIDFVKCLVTNPEHLCPRAVAAMPVPVEYCAPTDLHLAADECDVMLLWGDGFNEWLKPARPPLCVFVAHGESWWTAQTLAESGHVIDHAIAVSQRVREQVCDGVPATTILNGVDASHLGQTCSRESVRARLGFAPQDFVLGSVGRFSEEKRMPLLIEAVARLPREFKLMLVGHGARRNELLDHANERIPGRFAFVSAVDYLGDYYRAMDAFGLVSQHEGFGLVIAEALLCERPVIATDIGCVPEIICDRVNGLVVDPTPGAIADAVRMLQQHPHWARGLATEGRIVADEKLHARRMAREYEQLLWQLWNEKVGTGAGDA